MIVTRQKNIEQVLNMLRCRKKVFLAGCASCATVCLTGGEKEVLDMKKVLEAAGHEVTGYAVMDVPCDERIVLRDYRKYREAVDGADAVLVLACGAGVQAVVEVIDKAVYPALDGLFIGTTKRIGEFSKFCSTCGECIIELTGGICPVTRCPKSYINGACGHVVEGKCGLDTGIDCVWALIYERLKKQGELGNLKKIIAPKDYSKNALRKFKTERKN